MMQDKNTPELPDHISNRTSGMISTFHFHGFIGRWGAWIVLLASLLITFNAWFFARGEATKKAQARFDFRVKTIETGIYERLQAYEFLLRGGSGLFATSDEVTREDWRTYIAKLQINQYYPGIQGVGFSKRILPSEKEAHLRQIRGEGFPQYTIKPDGERPEYTSIIFLEPFDWRNQRAFGYDMFSEPTRKEAMIRARDTGIAALSGKVTLVQETVKDKQAGFLIYLAIYRKGEPRETLEQRRKALMGYVYSPFRMNDFMKGILAEKEGYVNLQIFDGDKPLKETLLYRSETAEEPLNHSEGRHFATNQSILEYAGHRWLLSFVSSKHFEEDIATGSSNFILWLGITISLLLFGMVLSLIKSRSRAIALADTTLDLEKANIGLRKEIMERKQTEEERQKFAMVADSSSEFIGMCDLDLKPIYVNPAGMRMVGLPDMEAACSVKVPEYFFPEDQLFISEEFFPRVLREGHGDVEIRLRHFQTGKPIWVFYYLFHVHDVNGNLIGWATVSRDITERKRAEEERNKLQAQLSNAIEIAHLGHWEYDVINDIFTFNDHFYKMFRTTAEHVGGYTMSSPEYARRFIHPDDMCVVQEENRKAIEATDPHFNRQLEHRILYGDGTEGHISVKFFIVKDAHGRTVKTYGVNQDITERKRMEEELLRAQKLESVGVLAGGIAHDFNNILTTILGNVSLARMKLDPADELFDLLREAETASERAQTLTKQLLTFAKGGLPIKETTSVKDVIKESSLFVLRGSKSNCEFSIAEDLWPAEVDVGQISQVINNIVINANQAMPKGGTIQVAAENLIIEGSYDLPVDPGRYIRISIKDQGMGIAEDHLLNIFDPYFTTKHEGSGLGLATTYSIIKKHGGHITVDSRLGVGSTFHIYLPASDKTVPEKEEVKLIKGQGRILVMDDEASLRKMVGKMLTILGYESEFAKDGAEAIGMYTTAKESENPYDAVILDLTIPGGMGGKEAVNKLLEIDPGVKAIVSSGYSDDPVLSNFQEYGFKGIIPKPFESRSLGKVLHEVLKDEKE